MRTWRWLVMNSDEHMEQICVCTWLCVCVCVIMLLMQDLHPSLVSVPIWHSCIPLGGDILILSTTPTWIGFTGSTPPRRRGEGDPKTEEVEKDKLIQGFGKGIKEIKLDRVYGGGWVSGLGGLSILYPYILLLSAIKLNEMLSTFSPPPPLPTSVLLWFSVNNVSAALHR